MAVIFTVNAKAIFRGEAAEAVVAPAPAVVVAPEAPVAPVPAPAAAPAFPVEAPKQ